MKNKILMVDDDRALLKMLNSYFSIRGYEVETALDGVAALEQIVHKPDIILLDVNMPRMDGMELCRQIRDRMTCPILFLTAKVEEQDRINGLMSGGDDYILKPFSLRELEARIVAHLKREERHRLAEGYPLSEGLTIDYSSSSVQYNGQIIAFTRTEYEIIEFLSMHPGQSFDKERIYEKVCGYDGEGDKRSITELVRRIRGKLSAYTETEYIETVWGVGYRWKK